ncbi:fructoselysine 6-kinase [Fusibacter ferrireducens]|uniref:fructoselysine 6-kinase n=1 Tax=Fusibacter ferrireducens TaxID=2785058 RepID=UPI002B49D5F0|nr:fructoselysine 6-kinase [Fusibacter ferrireducens]
MEKNKYKIATIGDNCIDYYVQTQEAFPGGNPVNVAVYAKRLGHDAAYIGVVGDDENGQIIRKALKQKNVDISHLHVSSGSTAITEVTMENGNRVLGDYHEGVLEQFKLTAADKEFAGTHDLIVSGIWGKIEHELEALSTYGKPIAFDFADKMNHPVVQMALPYVDYAFFASETRNEQELKKTMKQLYAQGPKVIIVTLGERGSIAYDGTAFITYGIEPCEVVDTMGAGDSYIAGFLIAMLSGLSLEHCMAAGAQNSSVTIAYNGAW